MVIVDRALETREAEGRPVRVGLLGAGYMGRAIARQLLRPVPGLRLAVVGNRSLAGAERSYREAGVDDVLVCERASALEEAIRGGRAAVTDDPGVLCEAGGIDVVLEATGEIEFGAGVALRAIEHGKHVVLMNAELDATVGPMLKRLADARGVVITNADGDEPGVAMNLVRFARTIGYEPVCAGNVKGMLDRYRTPDTQRAFAERHRQKAAAVTSYADGTKLSMEATVLANATGFRVARRGMVGHRVGHVKDLLARVSPEDFREGGVVDYVVGAEPHTGAFVLGYNEHPLDREYMSYFKMGDGPLYCFYTPYHLPHLQVLTTLARAVIFRDPTVTPLGRPMCDVIAVAKRDLRAGEVLDGIGGFCAYGVIENAEICVRSGYLPMGLSPGARLRRDVAIDQPLVYADVELPAGGVAAGLRREQDRCFFGLEAAAEDALRSVPADGDRPRRERGLDREVETGAPGTTS